MIERIISGKWRVVFYSEESLVRIYTGEESLRLDINRIRGGIENGVEIWGRDERLYPPSRCPQCGQELKDPPDLCIGCHQVLLKEE